MLSHQGASFPILSWIQKLGEIHAAAPRLDWCLYLTLHGEVPWTPIACDAVRRFLRENFLRAQHFADTARILLGVDLFQAIVANSGINFSALQREQQQKVLMAFVPKKIADLVRPQMWRLDTKVNLRYGRSGHAPMVTWIIEFNYDARAPGTPDTVYLDSVNSILAASGRIDSDGNIINDI